MKYLVLFFLISLLSITFAKRHHNSDGLDLYEYNRIPDPLLCNNTICPSDRGMCTLDNICFCHPGYVTIYSKDIETRCDYKQKQQIVFLVLEFLISFGVGHFYAGRFYFGLVKLAFDILIFSVYCCCHALKNTEAALSKEAKIRILLMFLFTTWQVVDAIGIGMNYYKDGNGVALSPWF